MGYRTWYSLSMMDTNTNAEPENQADIIADLLESCEDAQDAIGPDGHGEQDTRWDNDDEDMCEFSKKYPHILFCLSGTGDADDDRWEGYYQDGKYMVCHAEIVYPPYDAAKMVAYDEVNQD